MSEEILHEICVDPECCKDVLVLGVTGEWSCLCGLNNVKPDRKEGFIAALQTALQEAEERAERAEKIVSRACRSSKMYWVKRAEEAERKLALFSYVEITSPGCEGWVNLFFGEYPVALIDSEKIANGLKELLSQLEADSTPPQTGE